MYYIPIRQISQQIIFVCFIFSVKTKDIDITISNILEGKIIIAPNASDNSILVVPSNKLQVSAEIRDKVNTQISVSIKGLIILIEIKLFWLMENRFLHIILYS